MARSPQVVSSLPSLLVGSSSSGDGEVVAGGVLPGGLGGLHELVDQEGGGGGGVLPGGGWTCPAG